MRTLPISKVKDKLNELVDAAVSTREQVTITKNGSSAAVLGVLVTVLSPAPIGRVLRPGSGGIRFAGALDSAIDRRSADGEQFG